MEIKGLAQSVARVRAKIATVRNLSVDTEANAGALEASLADINVQISALHADLKFDAETLGNSGPVSSQPSEDAHLPTVKS